MAEPDNLVLALLRELRHDMLDRFGRVDAKLEELTKRIDSVGLMARGESIMGRYTVAEVEDRLEKIERRLAELESGKH
jgi:hypothetical protein